MVVTHLVPQLRGWGFLFLNHESEDSILSHEDGNIF